MPHDYDLVGHLPPESVKPRMIWVVSRKVAGFPEVLEIPFEGHEKARALLPDKAGYRLFREVLPE